MAFKQETRHGAAELDTDKTRVAIGVEDQALIMFAVRCLLATAAPTAAAAGHLPLVDNQSGQLVDNQSGQVRLTHAHNYDAQRV